MTSKLDNYEDMKYIDYLKYNGNSMLMSKEGRYLVPVTEIPNSIRDRLIRMPLKFIAERDYDVGIKFPETDLVPTNDSNGLYLLSIITTVGPDHFGTVKTFYTVVLTNGLNNTPIVLCAGIVDDE